MFYVLIIRPQQKRTKQQAEMLTTLVPGVEIVTIGGIFATIVEVSGERLRIRVADGSELEITRRAVGSVVPVGDDADTADEDAEDADASSAPALGEDSPDDSAN